MSVLSTPTSYLARVVMVDPCPYDSSLFSALNRLEEGGGKASALEEDREDNEVCNEKKGSL